MFIFLVVNGIFILYIFPFRENSVQNYKGFLIHIHPSSGITKQTVRSLCCRSKTLCALLNPGSAASLGCLKCDWEPYVNLSALKSWHDICPLVLHLLNHVVCNGRNYIVTKTAVMKSVLCFSDAKPLLNISSHKVLLSPAVSGDWNSAYTHFLKIIRKLIFF